MLIYENHKQNDIPDLVKVTSTELFNKPNIGSELVFLFSTTKRNPKYIEDPLSGRTA